MHQPSPQPAPRGVGRWRTGVASQVVAAALSGLGEALGDRPRERPPQVEEAPEPVDDGWLVLLDRQEPSRSLIVLPPRLSGPSDPTGHPSDGDPPVTVAAR